MKNRYKSVQSALLENKDIVENEIVRSLSWRNFKLSSPSIDGGRGSITIGCRSDGEKLYEEKEG
jgi:hypothetical protein